MFAFRSAAVTAVSLLTAAATAVVGVGTATAAPGASRPADVHTKVSRPAQNDVRVAVSDGSIALVDGNVSIRSATGREVERFPLTYDREYRRFPIDARLAADNKSVTLTPSRDAARSTALDPATVDAARTTDQRMRVQAAKQKKKAQPRYTGPRTKKERDDDAFDEMAAEVGAAMSVGQIVGVIIGGILGVVVGCVVGFIVGFGILGPIVCPILAFIGFQVGAILGMAIIGGPPVVGAIQKYWNTTHSPFNPKDPYGDNKGKPKSNNGQPAKPGRPASAVG